MDKNILNIAVVQFECELGNIAQNVERITRYIADAKKQGCEMVVFPEMIDTGYEMETIRRTASTAEGEPFRKISQAAAKSEIYVVCGLSEKEGDKIYNATVAFDPAGQLIGKYRKTHLAAYPPLNEQTAITPGNKFEIIEINGLKIGLIVCYDLRFPEVARKLALQGVDAIVICSAWPFPRLVHWEILIRARAIENQLYVIAANRVGKDGEAFFCGASRIVDPYGVIVSSASENREELITATIKKETIEWVRRQIPVFEQRRDDLY